MTKWNRAGTVCACVEGGRGIFGKKGGRVGLVLVDPQTRGKVFGEKQRVIEIPVARV